MNRPSLSPLHSAGGCWVRRPWVDRNPTEGDCDLRRRWREATGTLRCNAEVENTENMPSPRRSCSPIPSTMAEVVGHRRGRRNRRDEHHGFGEVAIIELRPVRAHWPLAELKATDVIINLMTLKFRNYSRSQ